MDIGREASTNALGVGPGDALIVIDVQQDFLPGGALGIPGGNEVIEPLNLAIGEFEAARLPVFYTRDWHPAGHCSFTARGGPWPAHCVAGTKGAGFAKRLRDGLRRQGDRAGRDKGGLRGARAR